MMLLADIHFRREGSWDFILRSQFPLLIRWVRAGTVDALDAETISVEEAASLHDEGFSLVPDDMVVGIGPACRTVRILKIERSYGLKGSSIAPLIYFFEKFFYLVRSLS